MDEEWREILSFPGYSVSDSGRVRNDDTDRLLSLSRNQQGIVNVGLVRSSVQHKRSVIRIVADAFLPPYPIRTFDTPINLDGDRCNNSVFNLLWRPRWFAVKYYQQFHNDRRGFQVPVVETKTDEWFPTSWHAATKYGLLDREILIATLNRTYVWPTYQTFRVINENRY